MNLPFLPAHDIIISETSFQVLYTSELVSLTTFFPISVLKFGKVYSTLLCDVQYLLPIKILLIMLTEVICTFYILQTVVLDMDFSKLF